MAMTPFGGFKQSGNGVEGGRWGIEEYTRLRTVVILWVSSAPDLANADAKLTISYSQKPASS